MRPRPLHLFTGIVAALLAAVAGCARPASPGPGSGGTTGASPTSSASAGATSLPSPPPSAEPTSSVLEYRISYDWAVPSTLVTINHPIVPPIAPPPAPPLPYLVGIYVGDHPEGSPAYQRMSFYFRGAFPGYNFRYVPEVLSDGKGTPVPLPGNAFLRVVFVDAQAHLENGHSSVVASPHNPINLGLLKGYAIAGDFEGHVTYGLGLQVAAGSDQTPRIRVGELKKTDGAGGFFYVIHFDVAN